MMKALFTLALGAAAAGAGAADSQAEAVHTISIDAGGVNLELTDEPANTPPQLSYRAQGTCQPEVAITTSNGVLQARHLKSCHGTGDHEGTVFLLRLPAQSTFTLALGAGGVRISGDLEHFRSIALKVKVGGIRNYRRDLVLDQRRPFLIGATATLERDSGQQSMVVDLNYGGISLY